MNTRNMIILCLTLLFSTGLSGCSSTSNQETNQLDIVFFKIGKADSILLSIHNQTVLIDTGEDEDGGEVVNYMKENGIDTIDYLVITHFDKDHVGGADTIINEVKVLNVISPDYESESKEYKEYIEALDVQELSPLKITNKFEFVLGSAEFTIDPPQNNTYSGDNDYSLVISVEHGNNSFLFAGDAEEERLTELIQSGNLVHTFLKVPHHGRYNDKTEEFFTLVNPKYAVITSSDKNPEDEEVTGLLEQLGTKVYVTRNGDIFISSDGDSLRINQ